MNTSKIYIYSIKLNFALEIFQRIMMKMFKRNSFFGKIENQIHDLSHIFFGKLGKYETINKSRYSKLGVSNLDNLDFGINFESLGKHTT